MRERDLGFGNGHTIIERENNSKVPPEPEKPEYIPEPFPDEMKLDRERARERIREKIREERKAAAQTDAGEPVA